VLHPQPRKEDDAVAQHDELDGCQAVIDSTDDVTDELAELLCLFPGDLAGPVGWLAEQWRELFADGIPAPLPGAYDVCKVIDPETGDAHPSIADLMAAPPDARGAARSLAGYDLGLLRRLRAEGVNVAEVAGWQTRGSASYDPGPHLDHHTGGAGSALQVIINGRPDLPGPLSQTNQHRDGRVFLVAAGRANHAGPGGWKGYSGNSGCSGNERDNTGSEPWPPGSHLIAAKVAVAQLRGRDAPADLYCRHAEWAGPRKPDSHSVTGDHLRALARSLMAGSVALSADDRAVAARLTAAGDAMARSLG
jgi:hypothetical protein